MRKVSGFIPVAGKSHAPSTSRLRMQVTSNSKGYLELNLNGRELRSVPAETFQLTTTQVLRLAHNYIDYLPLMISYLRALKVLDLQHNLLVHLPETLVNCRHLADLNLAANRLSSLPKGIGGLKQLKILSLGENQFDHLPEEVGLLTSLKILDVHGNKLWHLPFSLQELRHLYNLNASDNMFDNVPLVITKITSLQKLNLSRNRLGSLPVGFDALKSLRELNLSHNGFVSISSLLVALKHLRYLSLAHNRVRFLPPQFSRLQNLRVLHLQHNELTRVPSHMTSVQYYNVASNQLTSFSVEGMRGLVSLTASCNNIEAVPQGLYKLRKLKFLYLDNNRLVELQEDVGLLRQLRVLDISNNKLIILPKSLYGLAKLQSFNVKDNHNLKRTGLEKDGPEFDKKELASFKKDKHKRKEDLRNRDEIRQHRLDSIGRCEDGALKEGKSGFNFDKRDEKNERKSRKSEANFSDSKYGYLKHVDTSSDLGLRAKEHENYLQRLKSQKTAFFDNDSRDSLRLKQSTLGKSTFPEQGREIPRKINSVKQFGEFIFGKTKRPDRTDGRGSGRCSQMKSGRSFQLPGNTQTDEVSRGNKDIIRSSINGNAEMDRISSMRRKGQIDKAHDVNGLILSDKPRLRNKTQFTIQDKGRQHDDDSKSDSHGYGSWRSRGRPQGHDHDTDSLLDNANYKYIQFKEKHQDYYSEDEYEHRNNGQKRNVFFSKAAVSETPFHVHGKQNQYRYQDFPSNSIADKLYSVNADSISLVDGYNDLGGSYSKFNNRDTWRVRNSDSGDDRSIIYSEFNSLSPGYRPSHGNGVFNSEGGSRGTFYQRGQVGQRLHESKPKLLPFQHEKRSHDEWAQRSTPKQRNYGHPLQTYTTQHDYVPMYPCHNQENAHRSRSELENYTTNAFEAKLRDRSFNPDSYSHDYIDEAINRFCPRNQSFHINRGNPHQQRKQSFSYSHQSSDRESSRRNRMSSSLNSQFPTNHLPPDEDLYIQDNGKQNRSHHPGNISEHGGDTVFKSKQTYPEYNHVLSTKNTPQNECDTRLHTFVARNNSFHANVHNKSQFKDKFDNKQRLTRSRSVDSLLERTPECGAYCKHVNHLKDPVRKTRVFGRAMCGPTSFREAGSDGVAPRGEGSDHGRTDFSLLGVCSQVETLLNKGLLRPVIAFTHTGNKRFADRPAGTASDPREMVNSSTPSRDNRNVDANEEEAGPPCLVYSQPQTFNLTREGGHFVSRDGSKVEVTTPALAVAKSMNITVQLLTISENVISKVKELNYFVDNIMAMGPVVLFEVSNRLQLNSPATITIPAPADVPGGHLVVLTVRSDNSCVPCSDGFRSRKMAATFSTWHFSGKVALITRAKCKYKACKSVELLLQCLGVKQV